MVVEITPKTPFSALGDGPVPLAPSQNIGTLVSVHVVEVVTVVEFSEFGIKSVVIFTNLVSGFVVGQSKSLY